MVIVPEKILPVVVSIIVIILVAIISESSRTIAAITATMPIAIPLSIWIAYNNAGGDQEALVTFNRALIPGMFATIAFVFGAWLAARAGYRLIPTILAGYGTWLVVLLVMSGLDALINR